MIKMIRNCFKQYYGGDSIPIGDKEQEELIKRIFQAIEDGPAADLYEAINDAVYEFLAGTDQ